MKKGIAASKGYAIGTVVLKENDELIITDEKVTDIQAEKERLQNALEQCKVQLTSIKEKALAEMGEEKAAVFDSHIMLLDDPEFTGAMEMEIESNNSNALKAVDSVAQTFLMIFESMEDEYMRERAADIKDVANRIKLNLAGKAMGLNIEATNTIVVAYDLTPSDTAQLDRSKVVAFLTDIGGRTSHSAIMARTLEIPAIVGLNDITSSLKD